MGKENREQGRKETMGDGGPWSQVWRAVGAGGRQPALWALTHCWGTAVQVGDAFNKEQSDRELKLIASDPDETHAFKVTNYTALGGLLSKLQQSIIHTEGACSRALCPPGAVPSELSRKPKPCTPAPALLHPVWLSEGLPSPL